MVTGGVFVTRCVMSYLTLVERCDLWEPVAPPYHQGVRERMGSRGSLPHMVQKDGCNLIVTPSKSPSNPLTGVSFYDWDSFGILFVSLATSTCGKDREPLTFFKFVATVAMLSGATWVWL